MYDIRQFKPVLYAVVLLGVIGFALAAQSPALFVFAIAAIGVNAWLVATNRFTPLPRWVANGITLLSFLFVANLVMGSAGTPIVIVGQFLVLLQIVKLYEQRANRDYAQLLILGLLLMVAASITTASLLFGVLLIAYLFLSLYCCLLFHLKVETDMLRAAHAANAARATPALVAPMTDDADQRSLARSMRRLTGLVSVVAIAMAVFVFLIFPRGSGANMLGPLNIRPSQALTGFSDQMSFQQIANITQNTEVVAYVRVTKNGQPFGGTEALYLRGNTLDSYDGNADTGWRWSRSVTKMRQLGRRGGSDRSDSFPPPPLQPPTDGGGRVAAADDPMGSNRPVLPGGSIYRQQIKLMPTGTSTIFAMPFPVRFTPNRPLRTGYSERDEVIVATDALNRQLEYVVDSTDLVSPLTPLDLAKAAARPADTFLSKIDPRIRQYADKMGLEELLARRAAGSQPKVGWSPHELDGEIAAAIERHFHKEFQYTLDLTEFGQTHDEDPIVRFLYDFKRGHCEYFAGAMTLLCQSLDIRSRVVIGFKCDEFTALGEGLYTVRQSHAHAWVEVQTPAGWRTFDPTSGSSYDAARNAGLMQRVRGVFNFLEFKWADSVIAYDNDNRDSLMANVSLKLDQQAVRSSQSVSKLTEALQGTIGTMAARIVGPIVMLLLAALCLAIGYFAWERWRMRRRAERIGLGELSGDDQMRLVRQLGFYDDLMRLLERHALTRPPHLTPKEFTDGLSFLPSEAYDAIRRMTRLFYKIRYGRVELSPSSRKRLNGVLERVEASLNATHPTT